MVHKRKNYSAMVSALYELDLVKGTKKSVKEWNEWFCENTGIQGNYISFYSGIRGNDSGIISIKSTNNKKYQEDRVLDGVVYYDTKETLKENFYDEPENRGLLEAFNKRSRFMVFKGSNSSLEFLGWGIIEDYFVSHFKKVAVFKINIL